jgi:hypothetical protein
MKKILLGLLLGVGIATTVFSIEESWLSFGTAFGNYFDNGSDLGDFYLGSPGLNLSGYGFWDQKNIGIFYNYGLLYPVANNIGNNYSPYMIQFDLMMGPSFRYNINEKLKLHFGIGLAFNSVSLWDRVNNNEKTSNDRFSLGIGGDVGIKYDITDVVYLNFGVALMYNFAGYNSVSSTLDNWSNTKSESSGWINGYSMFGIRPYIAIGFNYYQEKGKWGKPNK